MDLLDREAIVFERIDLTCEGIETRIGFNILSCTAALYERIDLTYEGIAR